MSSKTALEYVVDLTGVTTELATSVRVHEDAINDLQDAVDKMITESDVRAWIAESKDPLWVRILVPAVSTITAAFVIWLFGTLSGHVSIQFRLNAPPTVAVKAQPPAR